MIVAGRLRELHGLDFVFPSAREDPELMYSFKHALTQDVVYAGVLERRRRQVPRGGRAAVSRSCTPDVSTTSSS